MSTKSKNKNNNKKSSLTNPSSYQSVSVPYAQSKMIRSVRSPPVIVSGKQTFPSLTTGMIANGSRYYVYPISNFMGSGVDSWLYSVSLNYSKIRFRKLKFHYVSSSPTTLVSNVSMGVGYDMADFFPETVGGILLSGVDAAADYTGPILTLNPSVNVPVWQNAEITVDTKDFQINKVCTAGDFNAASTTVLSALSRNFFSDGYLVVAVAFNNTANAPVAGRIIAEYEVEFYDPIPTSFNI